MGYETDYYVDFVFELQESSKQDEKIRTKRSCSEDKCRNSDRDYISANFCSICGSEIIEKQESLGFDYPSVHEFCDDHLDGAELVATDNSDEGYGLPENVWIYNYKTPEDCFVGLKRNEGALDLTELDIKASIERFKSIENVQKVLETFESIYGKDSIKIKFMFFSTYY